MVEKPSSYCKVLHHPSNYFENISQKLALNKEPMISVTMAIQWRGFMVKVMTFIFMLFSSF